MKHQLLVNPPVGGIQIFGPSLSQRQSATRAGAILRRDAGVGTAEAQRIVNTLTTIPLNTEIAHRSGYRFKIIGR